MLFFQIKKQDLFSNLVSHGVTYPTPKNLNIFWVLGSLLSIGLVYQIISGIGLAMHYTPHTVYAFDSIEHILRDVNFGFFLRNIHSNGASFLFFLVYIHIFRGFCYNSFIRSTVWISGIVLFILLMAISFLGYILPWGQMSYWGATVITNLVTSIPLIGDSISIWLWGGFAVDNPTLNRFFSLHYLLPFILLGIIGLHFLFLHREGSNTPTTGLSADPIPFKPYIIIKDLQYIFFYLTVFVISISFFPLELGHTDNSIPANSLVTPTHIVPEWYFLPFYAILRSFENKLGGVLCMGLSLVILFIFLNITKTNKVSSSMNFLYQLFCYTLILNFVLLGWVGQQVANAPYSTIGFVATLFYFFTLFSMYQVHTYRELL